MKKRRQIENIEPFNEIWYDSCWYSSLFPVIRHYGRPIEPFLTKDVFYYEQKEDRLVYSLLQTETDDGIFRKLGLSAVKRTKCRGLKSRVINAVNAGRCVIFSIDPFYEPLRPDYYQIKHFSHYLLVYGYDLGTGEFLIIENDFINSLRYKKQAMKIKDAERCYYGYLDSHDTKERCTYWEIASERPYTGGCDPADTLMRTYLAYEDRIRAGVHCLDILIGQFETAIEKQDKEHIDVKSTFQMLQDILHRKNMQIYQFKKTLPLSETEARLLDTVYNNFSAVRNQWGRCAFMGVFDYKLYKKSYEKLLEIKKTEAQWNDILFSFKCR